MKSPTNHSVQLSRMCALLGCLVLARPATGAIVVNGFDDIVNWTGSGANQAALVIDWSDGSEPLAWGFRFDSAKSQDMLQAIVQADSRLFAKVEAFGFGWFVHGLGYDRNNSGFAITSGTDFGASGFVFSGLRNDARATDPADSYRETDAAFSKSWGYWLGAGASYPGVGWTESLIGISDRQLSNQSWDGFRFDSLSRPGTAFAAVPESHSAATLLLVLLLATFVRHNNSHKAVGSWFSGCHAQPHGEKKLL